LDHVVVRGEGGCFFVLGDGAVDAHVLCLPLDLERSSVGNKTFLLA
jgi:hypothetical protein